MWKLMKTRSQIFKVLDFLFTETEILLVSDMSDNL